MLGAVNSNCVSRDTMQLRTNRSDVDERLGLAQAALVMFGFGTLEEPLVLGFDPRR